MPNPLKHKDLKVVEENARCYQENMMKDITTNNLFPLDSIINPLMGVLVGGNFGIVKVGGEIGRHNIGHDLGRAEKLSSSNQVISPSSCLGVNSSGVSTCMEKGSPLSNITN